jgi:predicted phage terminase large subunit-like protein
MAESGWNVVRLPLVAIRTGKFNLGHDVWVREKGNILRPDAYPAREIERLQRSQVAPPFQLFYQQGLGSGASKIRADHFQSYAPHEIPMEPVVLSIDPSHDGGSHGSRAAMQAWKKRGSSYYLLDEFCEPCDIEKLRQEFWRFVRRYNPALALVERTADGPALRTLVQRKTRFEVRLVTPRQSKADRLDRHLAKIRGKKIYLPVDSIWREPFINEIINFPGEFDDRVDAMTQYLDFAGTGEVLRLPPPRAVSVVALSPARWR